MSITVCLRSGVFALAALAALLPTASAGVRVVAAGGGGGYTQIAAAVAAANNGDTILVRAGAYNSFSVNGKSLVIVADAGASVTVNGSISVLNLPASAQVVISGLSADGQSTAGPGIVLLANAGPVRVQNCLLEGATNPDCAQWPGPGDGRPGALVLACDDAAFTNCILLGGEGHGEPYGFDCYIGGTGGSGLRANESVVTLYNCAFQGAQGGAGRTEAVGGNGGDGASAQGGRLFASACTFQGGPGGLGCDFIPVTGYGNGGDGLRIESDSEGALMGNVYDGGPKGISAFGFPGLDGLDLRADGPTTTFTGSGHRFDAAPVAVRENQNLTLSFTGAPGNLALLIVGLGPSEFLLPNVGGVVMIDLPILLGPLALAPVPGGGLLNLTLHVPALSASIQALPIHMQGLVSEAAGLRLAGGVTVVLLDSSF